jgi:hypothetical protein
MLSGLLIPLRFLFVVGIEPVCCCQLTVASAILVAYIGNLGRMYISVVYEGGFTTTEISPLNRGTGRYFMNIWKLEIPELFEWRLKTKIVYGLGCRADIGKEFDALGASRVMVITDKGVSGTGIINKVEEG